MVILMKFDKTINIRDYLSDLSDEEYYKEISQLKNKPKTCYTCCYCSGKLFIPKEWRCGNVISNRNRHSKIGKVPKELFCSEWRNELPGSC